MMKSTRGVLSMILLTRGRLSTRLQTRSGLLKYEGDMYNNKEKWSDIIDDTDDQRSMYDATNGKGERDCFVERVDEDLMMPLVRGMLPMMKMLGVMFLK